MLIIFNEIVENDVRNALKFVQNLFVSNKQHNRIYHSSRFKISINDLWIGISFCESNIITRMWVLVRIEYRLTNKIIHETVIIRQIKM